MSDYHGSAELLDADRNVIIETVIYLRSTTGDSGLSEWAGRVEPTSVVPDLDKATTIRLPSRNEGDVIVSNVEVSSGGQYGASQTAWLQGSGPAPF